MIPRCFPDSPKGVFQYKIKIFLDSLWNTPRGAVFLYMGFGFLSLAIFLERFEGRFQLLRQTVAELLVVAFDLLRFGRPALLIHVEDALERLFAVIEPFEVDILRVGHIADRRLPRIHGARAALQDPFEHAHVVAEARPEEFAVRALTEPVDVEDLGRILDPDFAGVRYESSGL